MSPDVGVPLTVFKTVTDSPSKGAGNYAVLHGTLSDGRKVEMTVGHMQNGSVMLKPGDVVNPGDLIGLVGNTGMTTDRSKGGKVTAWYPGKKSGHHMDLKIKIDGKYVDPETLQLGPTREAAARMVREELDGILFNGKDGI